MAIIIYNLQNVNYHIYKLFVTSLILYSSLFSLIKFIVLNYYI